MDILSDVSIKGDLSLSGNINVNNDFGFNYYSTKLRLIGCADHKYFDIGIGNSRYTRIYDNSVIFNQGFVEFPYQTRFGENATFKGDITYFPDFINGIVGKITYHQIMAESDMITVPANCSKFQIKRVAVETKTEFTDDTISRFYSYPLVTAFNCGKKVELDLEISTDGTAAKRFTEVVYGNVIPSTTDRDLFVTLLFPKIMGN